jgi:RNA polymerase sigma-70 factor (ECF subfamily)
MEHLDEYRGEGVLEGWAGRVAHRVVMSRITRERRAGRVLTLVGEDVGVSSSDIESAAQRKRARERLAGYLGQIPQERRTSLVLRLVYEHSVAEVAELTGVSPNTTKDRLRTGLRELRRMLADDPEAQELMREVLHG